MKQVVAIAFALALLSQNAVFAEGKVEIAPADSPATLLQKLVGQKVEIHLKSGEKIAGKLESASPSGVHLSNLAGQEFFDAVIAPADITAVVVRVR